MRCSMSGEIAVRASEGTSVTFLVIVLTICLSRTSASVVPAGISLVATRTVTLPELPLMVGSCWVLATLNTKTAATMATTSAPMRARMEYLISLRHQSQSLISQITHRTW